MPLGRIEPRKIIETCSKSETALAGLHHLIEQQTQIVVTALGSIPMIIPDSLSTTPIQPSEPDELKQVSPRARDIFFQLKTAVAIHPWSAE